MNYSKFFIPIMMGIFCVLFGTINAQVTFSEDSDILNVDHVWGVGEFGGGVSFVDFNDDGWDDISLTTGAGNPLQFFQNMGGTYMRIPAFVTNTDEAKQLLWVDYDNDGDKDIFLTTHLSGNFLFQNDGSLSFTDVTLAAGLPAPDSMPTFGAGFADYDLDGWLDFYIVNRSLGIVHPHPSNYLYHNNGDGTFSEVTLAAGVPDSLKGPFCGYWGDINNDRYPDNYIAQDKNYGNTLYKNNGDGTFDDISASSGAGGIMEAMCTNYGDPDMDGDLDIYVTNTPVGNHFYINNGDETFNQEADIRGVAFYGGSWGSAFVDYDCDMDEDLYICGEGVPGSGNRTSEMFDNDGTGMFTVATAGFADDTMRAYSNAIGDVNNDGYPDMIVTNFNGDSTYFWRSSGGTNNWLKMDVQGTMSNRSGIGTRIEAYIGSTKMIREVTCGTGYLAQNTICQFLGLGTDMVLDSINLRWPSGHVDHFDGIIGNKRLLFVEDSTENAPALAISAMPGPCDPDSVLLDAGSGFDTYLWSSGETTQTVVAMSSGTYSVTMTRAADGFCFHRSANVVIGPGSAPMLSTVAMPSLCAGSSTGRTMVFVTGGSAPYSYAWSTGATTDTLNGVMAGMYIVSVTDAGGCMMIDTATVTEPTALSLSGSSTPESSGLSDGTATATVSGATPPYTYLWNDVSAQTTATATGLPVGTYTVVISDANGCVDSMDVMVSLITSTGVMFAEGMVNLFPNPTQDQFFLEFELESTQLVEIEISDLAGRTVLTKSVSVSPAKNRVSILTTQMSIGIYGVRIGYANGENVFLKLGVQK